jgi:hypothetical protein
VYLGIWLWKEWKGVASKNEWFLSPRWPEQNRARGIVLDLYSHPFLSFKEGGNGAKGEEQQRRKLSCENYLVYSRLPEVFYMWCQLKLPPTYLAEGSHSAFANQNWFHGWCSSKYVTKPTIALKHPLGTIWSTSRICKGVAGPIGDEREICAKPMTVLCGLSVLCKHCTFHPRTFTVTALHIHVWPLVGLIGIPPLPVLTQGTISVVHWMARCPD